jgi:hypothetical protein
MSIGNDRTLSAEELAVAASTLVDKATIQQDFCDELLRKLETALNAFDRGITELTRDMPSNIAKQAAGEVVQKIGDQVARKVADVLQPAEAKTQALLENTGLTKSDGGENTDVAEGDGGGGDDLQVCRVAMHLLCLPLGLGLRHSAGPRHEDVRYLEDARYLKAPEHVETEAGADGFFISGTAATGPLRRTSMELTRALADLRRPE